MSTGFAIKNVTNPLDAATLSVTLDGQPDGDPTFLLCRTPDRELASAAAASLTNGVYAVTCPHPSLWYVWGQDAQGITDEPGCAWCGLSDNPDLDLCGQALARILTQNQAALEVALKTYFKVSQIKQIVYGSAASLTDYPAILITKPREQAQYAAMPYVRDLTYTFDIMFTILHQDRASMLTAATRLSSRIVEIFNQPAYEGLTLPSGTALAFCQCQEGEADEVEYGDNKWAAVGSTVWSGKALLQDGDGRPADVFDSHPGESLPLTQTLSATITQTVLTPVPEDGTQTLTFTLHQSEAHTFGETLRVTLQMPPYTSASYPATVTPDASTPSTDHEITIAGLPDPFDAPFVAGGGLLLLGGVMDDAPMPTFVAPLTFFADTQPPAG